MAGMPAAARRAPLPEGVEPRRFFSKALDLGDECRADE